MHAQSLSYVGLFATLWTVAHQALLSIGFPGKNASGSSQPRDQTLVFYVSCIGR